MWGLEHFLVKWKPSSGVATEAKLRWKKATLRLFQQLGFACVIFNYFNWRFSRFSPRGEMLVLRGQRKFILIRSPVICELRADWVSEENTSIRSQNAEFEQV